MRIAWKKMGNAAALTAALFATVTMASCGDDDDSPSDPNQPGTTEPGPIDGSWTLERVECDGSPVNTLVALDVGFEFTGASAEGTVRTEGCAITARSAATYSGSQVSLRDESVTCVPLNCDETCDDPVSDEPEVVQFTRTGDSLRLESPGGDDGFCEASQTQAFILSRNR